MKSFVEPFFLLFLLISSVAEATKGMNEIHLFIPGLQYRYENDSDQTVRSRRYDNYNLSAIIFDDYLIGAEFNQKNQDTSDGAIQITEKFQEFNLYFGYFIYSKLLNSDYKIAFDLGPVGYIGQNRSTVQTIVGPHSEQAIGEDNLVYGLGIQATLRAAFLMIQPEIRYAASRSYQPSPLPVYGLRVGFRIGF